MTNKPSFEIKKFGFNPNLLPTVSNNHYVGGLWPVVYILSDGDQKEAYVGETTDALARFSTHLKNNSKNKLTAIHLITSDKFNKSATLDIESNLIKYISGDGQFKLLNANLGLANHTYYQKKEIYWDIFKTIWDELKTEGISKNTLKHIDNSDLFKYSPYKSLSIEQKASIVEIIKGLLTKSSNSIVVEGGAGTGKTILATFLFKLLNTDIEEFNTVDFGSSEQEFVKLIIELKKKYPNPSMALVVPMSSFRNTLKKVFKNIKGLSAKMVIGPAEVANNTYDILIVDESHRLRKRVNLGAYFGAFDIANEKLKLDKYKGNELDWILKQGKSQIFFYDENQSIKPSDVDKKDFDLLKARNTTILKTLTSQFRVKGGVDYVSFVDRLLKCKFRKNENSFASEKYELLLFDSIEDLISKIKEKEKEVKLSRLVAGYSWEWVSKKKDVHDIIIGNVKLKWNGVSDDWVNSENSINEVGCIHTTQGYDLNYTGIIFGNEISYDWNKNEIVIKEENYFDKNGKQSIKNPLDLKDYILNIYKTIMLRGIRGTYIYVCDPNLRDYFRQHISTFSEPPVLKVLPLNKVEPFINSVPLYDISVAAGNFSELQQTSDFEWVELPAPLTPRKDYFVCRVIGDSMNKIIPNGSWCLFQKDPGGSREGKIVLVEHFKILDSDFGAGYTIKSYHSEKKEAEDNWSHKKIVLKPMSNNPDYKEITLNEEVMRELKVVGIFVCVLV